MLVAEKKEDFALSFDCVKEEGRFMSNIKLLISNVAHFGISEGFFPSKTFFKKVQVS